MGMVKTLWDLSKRVEQSQSQASVEDKNIVHCILNRLSLLNLDEFFSIKYHQTAVLEQQTCIQQNNHIYVIGISYVSIKETVTYPFFYSFLAVTAYVHLSAPGCQSRGSQWRGQEQDQHTARSDCRCSHPNLHFTLVVQCDRKKWAVK